MVSEQGMPIPEREPAATKSDGNASLETPPSPVVPKFSLSVPKVPVLHVPPVPKTDAPSHSAEEHSVSFFERLGVCLCVVHRTRSFIPGVREKLVAIADELSKS